MGAPVRAVVSRVTGAQVSVDGEVVGAIGAGLLVLLGVTHSDTAATASAMAAKIAGLRVMRDGDRDEAAPDPAGTGILVVSQFTLYGDVSRGRRPSWVAAAPGPVAEPIYDGVVHALRGRGLQVATGRFGALMAVSSTNDGPFTLILDL